jgi:hypothetical protein
VTATAILDLERAGFTREQVEALARWRAAEIDLSHLATKADVAGVRTELAELKGDLRTEIAAAKFDTIKWVVGVGVVQVGTLIGVAYAILKLFPSGHP